MLISKKIQRLISSFGYCVYFSLRYMNRYSSLLSSNIFSGWLDNFFDTFSTRGERHFDSEVSSPIAR